MSKTYRKDKFVVNRLNKVTRELKKLRQRNACTSIIERKERELDKIINQIGNKWRDLEESY